MNNQKLLATIVLLTILIGSMTGCTTSNHPDVAQSYQSNSSKPRSANHSHINKATVQQIKEVLTPDQKQELESKLQQGKRMGDTLHSLNLTPDQKAKIKDIFKADHAQRKQQFQTNSQ